MKLCVEHKEQESENCPACEKRLLLKEIILLKQELIKDQTRVIDLMKENIQLRHEQYSAVCDTSEYRELLADRQKLLLELFSLKERIAK